MKTILIVDDEVKILLEMKGLLERIIGEKSVSAETIIANSGVEALGIVSGQIVDLLILDYDMPEISGLQLIESIPEEFRMAKILMTTDRLNLEERIKAAELGIAGILQKPVKGNELREILRRLL